MDLLRTGTKSDIRREKKERQITTQEKERLTEVNVLFFRVLHSNDKGSDFIGRLFN